MCLSIKHRWWLSLLSQVQENIACAFVLLLKAFSVGYSGLITFVKTKAKIHQTWILAVSKWGMIERWLNVTKKRSATWKIHEVEAPVKAWKKDNFLTVKLIKKIKGYNYPALKKLWREWVHVKALCAVGSGIVLVCIASGIQGNH